MSLEALEALDAAQHHVEPFQQPVGAQVAEVVGGHRREQAHPDVGRRRAARQAPGLGALALLEIVGRQPAVGLGDEGLEVAPRRAGGAAEPRPLVRAERADARARRDAQPVGQRRSGDPQQQERRRHRKRVAPPEHHREPHRDRDDRTPHHLDREASEAAAAHEARGARRGARRRLPLQQPALRHHEAHQRQRDRVHGVVGVEREQRQAEEHLRHRRRGVVAQVGEEHRNGLRAARADQQPRQHRQQLRGGHDHHDGRPDAGAPRQRQPPRHQQRQQRRRHEAAAQVVENLPAPDRRQRVALEAAPRRHEGEQPEQDLPVAAHPPVLPPCVRQHARRVVVHELDVRHQRDACVQPFEQIVGEQRVLRHRVFERRDEGVDVVEPLAGEDPLGEEILIGVGHRGRVRVHAGVPRIEPGKERTGRAHERDADARLQDPVALGDAAGCRIERGPAERVDDDADQLAGDAARQPGVAVERDAVLDVRQDRQVADRYREARVGGAAQEPVELLDLAALALPPHPQPFAGVPLPQSMKQEETVGAIGGVPGVERGDAGASRLEDLGVLRLRLGGGVGKVAEEREVDPRIEVAERLHFEVRDELLDPGDAVEQRRHDHHRPRRRRHVVELDARQPSRWNQHADKALEQVDHQLAGRHHGQQRHHAQRRAAPPLPLRVGHGESHEQRRAGGNRPQVAWRGPGKEQPADAMRQIRLPRHADLERAAAGANQVIAHVRRAIVGRAHVHLPGPFHALERQQQLRLPRRPGQLLHGVAVAVAAAEIHLAVHARRVALQHLLDQADALEELAPVEGADETQAGDEIRDGGLLGGLLLSVHADGVLHRLAAVRQQRVELPVHGRGDRPERARTPQEPRDERRVHLGGPGADALRHRLDRRRQPVGGDAMRPRLGQHVAALAEVIDEGQLEHAGPCPELADRERRNRLERGDEPLQPLRVEPARARSDELERQRIHARQPGKLVSGHPRQALEVRRRQVVVDVTGRRRHHVEVVEQPFRRRRYRLLPRVVRQLAYTSRSARMWSLSRRRWARALPLLRGAIESNAARRRACSSSISMLSSSTSPFVTRGIVSFWRMHSRSRRYLPPLQSWSR